MDEHDRSGIRASPTVGWMHLGVDSFPVVGVDVDLAWFHGLCVGAGGSVGKYYRYTYSYEDTKDAKIKADVLRTSSCRADLRLGTVKSGGSPTPEY